LRLNVAAADHFEQTEAAVDAFQGSGESAARKLARNHAGFRRMPGVHPFHHSARALSESLDA
jgi:hypothetical protein